MDLLPSSERLLVQNVQSFQVKDCLFGYKKSFVKDCLYLSEQSYGQKTARFGQAVFPNLELKLSTDPEAEKNRKHIW